MFANGPRSHEYLHEMYTEVFPHYDALTLGEMSCGITPELGAEFVTSDEDKKQLDLILHFDHIELDCYNGDKWLLREWKLSELKERVTNWQTKLAGTGGWDTIWMENHDQPRGLSRFCNGGKQRREHGAKVLALWLFSLRGTVIMFQGQELGMTNPEQFSEDMCRDIETRVFWNKTHAAFRGKGEKHKIELAKKAITTKGRDASRIPIPCDRSKETSGGFTKGEARPWLPMHPNFTEFCTESQRRNPSSIWMSYRDMIRLRKQHKALASYPSMWASLSRDWPCWQVYGSYELIDPDHLSVFAYTRTDEHETYLVVLSFAEERVEWDVPVAQRGEWQIVISNFGRVSTLQELGDKLELGTFDGIIWRRGIMWTGACQ